MRRDVIRLSYSQILRLRRCPWAWHVRHVRKLVPLRRKRPPPAWGDAYHAAAAVVWTARAVAEGADVPWLDCATEVEPLAHAAALARLEELAVIGLDNEAIAAECAAAAIEVCRFVVAEWRVLWLDGEPVVERRLVTQIGDVDGVPVELVAVLDLALVHADGRVRVVDHKSTTSWPESVGDALQPDEELDLDLRDDLQVRLYVLAMREHLFAAALANGAPLVARTFRVPTVSGTVDVTVDDLATQVEGAHLVRRASVGCEPPRTHNGRGPLSRAAEHESTVEQWETAIRRHHLRREDYEQQIAQARLRRWHAWAPCEFTPQSLELARREALQAAAEIARLDGLEGADVPRHRMPGRWQPYRPQRWAGSAPMTDAECFAWNSCAACDHRDLCVAEGQENVAHATLILAGDFAHVDDVTRARVEREPPPCELDADEVE